MNQPPIFVGFIHWTAGVAGRKELVTQPGGLTLGFALHLVLKQL